MTDNQRYQYLEKYSAQTDKEIDLAHLAIDMVALDHEGVSVDRYIQHFNIIFKEVKLRYEQLISNGSPDDVFVRLAALKYVILDTHDYRVDEFDAEILEGADIMRVVDRAKGCSCALCVIYMITARKMGWDIEGVDFPNLFLCRLKKDGQHIIFNPAQQCKILQAHDLRSILKDMLGDDAELSNAYFDGLGARGTIINLCNNIKLRLIEMGDYSSALDMVLRMRVIAPKEYRLLLDSGVLYAKLSNKDKAIECLNNYIEVASSHEERLQAQYLMDSLF